MSELATGGRENIESLYTEIRELEAAFKRAKQSPLRASPAPVSRAPHSKLDSSRADGPDDVDVSTSTKFVRSQTDPLRDEIRLMENQLRRKDKALVEQTADLSSAKEKVHLLQRELESKNRVIQVLMDDKKSLLELEGQHQYTIKRLERDLQEQTRRLEVTRSARSGKSVGLLQEGRIDELNNELRRKSDDIESLTKQNAILVETMRKYDKALELLKSMASEGGDKTSLQEKLKTLSALKGSGVPVDSPAGLTADFGTTIKALSEETRLQKAEIATLSERCTVAEKTTKAQHQRIIYLTDRLDFVAARIKDGTLRRSVLNDSGLDQQLGASAKSAAERYSIEGEAMVPASLLEFVEKEVGVLNAQIKEVEDAMSERVETVEILQRKLEILENAREADAKKHRRETQELQQEIQASAAQLAKLDQQYIDRETDLKREKFELKSKLEKLVTTKSSTK